MSTKSTSPLRLCVLAIVLLTCASGALAQSQATTGNIEGRVLDPKDAAIPGASVTATNQQTGLARSATADDNGLFTITFLAPGAYTVRATATGFAEMVVRDVAVTVGGKAPLDIRLSVGGASGSVTVTSEASVVETNISSVSTTINSRAIENLPVNGRNYLDFATLTPGVIRDQNREGDLSVGGQKGTLNSLQVDGVDNNNTFFGQSFGRTGVRRNSKLRSFSAIFRTSDRHCKSINLARGWVAQSRKTKRSFSSPMMVSGNSCRIFSTRQTSLRSRPIFRRCSCQNWPPIP